MEMNLTNSHISKPNQVTLSKEFRDKLSPSKISNSLSARGLTRFDYEKVEKSENDNESKNIVHTAKTLRPLLPISNSFNKTLKGGEESKRPSSMIPRSKSRRRTGNENFKLDHTLKTDEPKERTVKKEDNEEQKGKVTKEELTIDTPPNKEYVDVNAKTSPSLSLKSCEDFESQQNLSNTSFKDAQEKLSQEIQISDEEHLRVTTISKDENEKVDEEEAKRQERMIKNLYEIISQAKEPLFENVNCKEITTGNASRSKIESRVTKIPTALKEDNLDSKLPQDCLRNFPNIQGFYEYTIREISEVWKNTISLIGSVKDHTLKFVDEKSHLIDKEQLSLEAEMLQLAVDFAINFSKLKTDFLLNGVKKRLEVKEIEKSELENFLESKTFAALYSDEDLAAMAQTVKELNASVLKGGDLELG